MNEGLEVCNGRLNFFSLPFPSSHSQLMSGLLTLIALIEVTVAEAEALSFC